MALTDNTTTLAFSYLRDSFESGDRVLARTLFGTGRKIQGNLEINLFGQPTVDTPGGGILTGKDITDSNVTISANDRAVRVPMTKSSINGFQQEVEEINEMELDESTLARLRGTQFSKALRELEKALLDDAMGTFEGALGGVSGNDTVASGSDSLTLQELNTAIDLVTARWGGDRRGLTVWLRNDIWSDVRTEGQGTFHTPFDEFRGSVSAYDSQFPIYISTSNTINSTEGSQDVLGYVWHKDAVAGGIGEFDWVLPTLSGQTGTYDLTMVLSHGFSVVRSDGVQRIIESS